MKLMKKVKVNGKKVAISDFFFACALMLCSDYLFYHTSCDGYLSSHYREMYGTMHKGIIQKFSLLFC